MLAHHAGIIALTYYNCCINLIQEYFVRFIPVRDVEEGHAFARNRIKSFLFSLLSQVVPEHLPLLNTGLSLLSKMPAE
jgi:hypothetical protein